MLFHSYFSKGWNQVEYIPCFAMFRASLCESLYTGLLCPWCVMIVPMYNVHPCFVHHYVNHYTQDYYAHGAWWSYPCIMCIPVSCIIMCIIIHGIIMPMVCDHPTHVQCASLFSPQKFGSKSMYYTQQNMVISMRGG